MESLAVTSVEGSSPEPSTRVLLRLNGERVTACVPDGELLASTIRDRFGLKGTKLSCAAEVCGACTVLVDGLPVSSCCALTVEAGGREVITVEGATATDEFERIERAFLEHAAVQCGFCTPGFVVTLLYLLRRPGPPPDDHELVEFLAGNICRCTGYRSLLDAAREILHDSAPVAP
jgi:carbon-monoxide dehydrogenase small subunit